MTNTNQHTCYGRVFCGFPREVAQAECPACQTPTVPLPDVDQGPLTTTDDDEGWTDLARALTFATFTV